MEERPKELKKGSKYTLERFVLLCLIFALVALTSSAQTQQGYVKTIGKPGKKGVALSGVTVRAKGNHNAVVSKSNGRFSMKMKGLKNGDAYSLQQVQKNGYELNDPGTVGRQYAFSATVPLTITMISTAQLQADKQRIENNAYTVAEKNYKAKMEKLEKQLYENTITAEEYRTALQELQDGFEKYQSLIESLADHYAHTDYDMLDENEAEINTLIENGELEKADSLIHTLFDPIDVLKRNKEALDRLDQTIADAQGILDQANEDWTAVLKKQEKDAEYLYQLYTIALAQFDNECAAKYIQTRAELDTTNVEWQVQTGNFISNYLANYDLALAYYLRGLRSAQVQYGNQSVWVALFYNQIGTVYYYKGDNGNALDYYQRALAIRENVLGTDHPNVATSYNNIGTVYSRKGDNDKALESFQRALAIQESVLGTDHPDVATSYNNIGTVYSRKGDNDKALEFYQRALAIRERVLGTDHPEVAGSCNNIGYVYYSKRNYNLTIEYYQRALDICERVLGTDHPKVATLYNNIGMVFDSKSDYDNALEYHQRALAIRERVFGADHLEVARSYNSIGMAYSGKGDYDKALENFQIVLAVRERVLGTDHLDVAMSYNNIGIVYTRKRDYDKTLEYYQKALAICERVLGTDHADVAWSYHNIGMAYYSKKDYDKALDYYQKALDIRERILETDHPDIATTCNNIGVVYKCKGDYGKALEYYQKALAIRERKLGNDNPNTQKVRDRIEEVRELIGE